MQALKFTINFTGLFFVVFFFPRTLMTILIFGVRAFISGAFQGFYVYTPEVLKTKFLRSSSE